MVTFCPSFITAPLPNCFSIWLNAVSSALFLSPAALRSGEGTVCFLSAMASSCCVRGRAAHGILFCMCMIPHGVSHKSDFIAAARQFLSWVSIPETACKCNEHSPFLHTLHGFSAYTQRGRPAASQRTETPVYPATVQSAATCCACPEPVSNTSAPPLFSTGK